MLFTRKRPFRDVYNDIMSKETIDILEKYQCIDKIEKVLDEHGICPCDLFDMACFFKDTIVVKIIQNNVETSINDIPCNQMFFIDFKSKTLEGSLKKKDDYVNKFNLQGQNVIYEFYNEDKSDFVLLLYKPENSYNFDEMCKLFEKYNDM